MRFILSVSKSLALPSASPRQSQCQVHWSGRETAPASPYGSSIAFARTSVFHQLCHRPAARPRCDKYIIDSYENSFKRKIIFFTIFCILSGFPLALFPIFHFSLQKDVSHRSLPFHFALSFSIYFIDFIYRPKKHLKLLFLRTFFRVKKIFSSVVFTRERILPCRYDIFLRFFCKSGNFVLMSSPETVDYIMRRTNFRQKSLFRTSSCVFYDYIVMKINFKQNSRPMIATMMSFFWNLPVQIAMIV